MHPSKSKRCFDNQIQSLQAMSQQVDLELTYSSRPRRASFVDAPPIPQTKHYQADVCNQSDSTAPAASSPSRQPKLRDRRSEHEQWGKHFSEFMGAESLEKIQSSPFAVRNSMPPQKSQEIIQSSALAKTEVPTSTQTALRSHLKSSTDKQKLENESAQLGAIKTPETMSNLLNPDLAGSSVLASSVMKKPNRGNDVTQFSNSSDYVPTDHHISAFLSAEKLLVEVNKKDRQFASLTSLAQVDEVETASANQEQLSQAKLPQHAASDGPLPKIELVDIGVGSEKALIPSETSPAKSPLVVDAKDQVVQTELELSNKQIQAGRTIQELQGIEAAVQTKAASAKSACIQTSTVDTQEKAIQIESAPSFEEKREEAQSGTHFKEDSASQQISPIKEKNQQEQPSAQMSQQPSQRADSKASKPSDAGLQSPSLVTDRDLADEGLYSNQRRVESKQQLGNSEKMQLPKKQKTVQINTLDLDRVKAAADSAEANADANQHSIGPTQYGTTMRTEIFTSDGEPPAMQTSQRGQKMRHSMAVADQELPRLSLNYKQDCKGRTSQLLSSSSSSRIKLKSKKGNSKMKTKTLSGASDSEDKATFGIRNLSLLSRFAKTCALCHQNGIEAFDHSADNCIRAKQNNGMFGKSSENKMLSQNYEHYNSQVILHVEPQKTAELLEKARQNHRQSYNVFGSAKLPELQTSPSQVERPSHQVLRRNISIERLSVPSQANFRTASKGGTTPREQRFSGVPVVLPKISDFWRGNKIGDTQYGDELKVTSPSVKPPLSSQGIGLNKLQSMSQQSDEEMFQLFARKNRLLEEQQRQLLQQNFASKAPPVRSLTHLNAPSTSSPDKMAIMSLKKDATVFSVGKKSGVSYATEVPRQPMGRTKSIRSKKERKAEVRRLQSALQQLLVNLGSSDVDTDRAHLIHEGDFDDALDQDRETSQEEESRSKKSEDGDKTGPVPSLRPDGASSVKVIDIARPATFDPNHHGLANLTEKQQARLKELGSMRDAGKPLSAEEENELTRLLNQLERGSPIDNNHPGLANLLPEERTLFSDLLRRQAAGDPPLTSKEAEDLEALKDKIVNGVPLDHNHPGFKNLTRRQKDRLKELLQIPFKDLTPSQMRELSAIQNQMLRGKPYGTEHPNFSKTLTIQQMRQLRGLLDREEEGTLNPAEKELLENLREQLVHGSPLDKNHENRENLTPVQLGELDRLVSRVRAGAPLSSLDQIKLQNLQNLLLNGSRLNESNPGFAKLAPKRQQLFTRLWKARKDGQRLSQEEQTALNRLLGSISLKAVPLSEENPGFNNLSSAQQQAFRKLDKKWKKQGKLSTNKMSQLKDLYELIRPAVDYDVNHPGYEGLLPKERLVLETLNQKVNAEQPLGQEEGVALEFLREKMRNPIEYGELHPGWGNCTAAEQQEFKKMQAKLDVASPLSFREEERLGELKTIMDQGRGLDEHHAGFDNLTPAQQSRFRLLTKTNPDALSPEQRAELAQLKDIMQNGRPFDETHPAFALLSAKDRERFLQLKALKGKGPLSEAQQAEWDELRAKMVPEQFTIAMKERLAELRERDKYGDGLDEKERQEMALLEDLKKRLPRVKDERKLDGLLPDERATLREYLLKRLFERPMTPSQLEHMDRLLAQMKEVGRDLTPRENEQLTQLARLQFRDVYVQAGERATLASLHSKQNEGVGNLTPTQYNVLAKVQKYKTKGKPLNETMQTSLDFLQKLRQLPSALNPGQEAELRELEAMNKDQLSPFQRERLQAFIKMRLYPQLMGAEDRAHFYMMKELESLGSLREDQKDELFALQRKFHCLPYLTEPLEQEKARLEAKLAKQGLSEAERKQLDRLRLLPTKVPTESDIKGLSPAECAEFKRLKARRKAGEQLSPEELARYKLLKAKVREAQQEETKEGSVRTPPHGGRAASRGAASAMNRAKSIMKTPDSRKDRLTPQRRVTYAAAPDLSATKSVRVPVLSNHLSSPENRLSQAKSTMPMRRDDEDEDGSPTVSQGRKAAQIAFKKAIKRGNCTLRELIFQFYLIEERYVIQDFRQSIRMNYAFAQANKIGELSADAQKPLSLRDFKAYAKMKKIKLKEHQIVAILEGESTHDNISFKSFIKLLILASCGGDRTKIGISNFKKLMNHMDIFKDGKSKASQMRTESVQLGSVSTHRK